ncbi:kinase-like domain-containing protein [Kockovaella imperatae]|uniref:non-specific serine/threonine protein kinase n=1 Tax=Kockovaella imperatae TaxID=4999 RepID=A0A1Y1US71_9TREE|nr:kinase-like domain-containing protein [Kockovaella imperatae]ORX40873.1 kinase-like domain-containing protein [Kockovaella imperatae]
MTEPNRLIHEEELEALRATFADDWHDIPATKTAWGTEAEGGWWEVTLRGRDDAERVSVVMRGKLTKKYPQQPPPITLLHPVFLSANHVHILSKLLSDTAKARVGDMMIYELADTAIEWISNNHLPLPKPGEAPNLMAELARREETKRAEEEAQRQAALERQQAFQEEENRRLTERIQINTSQKQERAQQVALEEAERQRQAALATMADGELEIRELILNSPMKVNGYDGSYRSWLLFGGQRDLTWTSYNAEPDSVSTTFVRANAPRLQVQVIDFSRPYYSSALGKKKIDSLVGEIQKLTEVQSDNVLKVYGSHRDVSPKGWERLMVLVEHFGDGGKLSRWTPSDGFGETMAREYIMQIMRGLMEIHATGITQKQLDLESVILCHSPASSGAVVKLSGTGYARRIADLHRSNRFLKNFEDSVPDSWLSPDEIDSPYTYSAKRDMWHAGVLLVQLIFGQASLGKYPNLPILLQSVPELSDNMIDLLSGLLHPNNKKRYTAEEALVRSQSSEMTIRKAVHWPNSSQSIASPRPIDGLGSSPTRLMGSYFPNTSMMKTPHLSRYRADFEEVEFLGKGGFGEVVKARNKLDGRSYAIKKVKLRPDDNEQKVYREVNNLSKVSHQHIVRYYGCWLEDIAPSRPATPVVEPAVNSGSTTTESDSDIYAPPNFNDLSFSRNDHSRSASFPRIRFANSGEDEDDEDDPSDESTSSEETTNATSVRAADVSPMSPVRIGPGPSVSVTETTEGDSGVQRILYIQMEFVEKQTLREAINQGLGDDELWRLFVQILQALAHMHGLGIVHRDLKPSNILLDATGNVKIADFGLSTTELAAVDAQSGLHPSHQSGNDDAERTSNIGTSLYIAPEVAISRMYNEKADMYSLGIIFFEMCFRFKTGMERVQMLQALRKEAIVFPSAWPEAARTSQKEIIKGLLRHEPEARPKATQLLSSSLLPSPEKQKEFYVAAIAELTNPRSTEYSSLLRALFDPHNHAYSVSVDNRLDDYTFDNDVDDELQVWLTVVIQRLVELFERHGAVETYLPLLMPETTLLSAFPDLSPVRMLDQGGKLVQLPSSELLSMARTATRRRIERIKRYHVGHKYTDHPAGGQPRATGDLTFDIVSPLKSAVAEAELLEVVDKVISEFQGIRASTPVDYEFHINHESVLSTILATVPDRLRFQVLKAFKSIGPGVGSAQSRMLFSGVVGLSKPILDDLEQCCIAEDFDTVRGRLEGLFSSGKRKLSPVFDNMATIIRLARACGVSRKIVFRPTLARNAEFFRGGFMFECVRRGKQREVMAFGGRYDCLLEHFKEPAQQMQSRKVYGVGMSIAVDQLARMVRVYESSLSERLMNKEKENERSFGFWSPSRCDVYLAAVTQVDLATRLSIIGELWRAGVRADLQYDDDRSLDEVATECYEQSTLYLVIPRANRPTLKVRSILKRTEEEVLRAELCVYLRLAIAEQRRIDATYASAEGSMPSLQAAALAVDTRSSDIDIRLVLPPEPNSAKGTKGRPVRKHRHVTKTVYYDKASEFAESTRSTLPIVGVDLAPSILAQMALESSWLSDEEAWRTLLAPFSTADRRYVESIRDAIVDIKSKSEGDGWLWLFGVRDNKVGGLHGARYGL